MFVSSITFSINSLGWKWSQSILIFLCSCDYNFLDVFMLKYLSCNRIIWYRYNKTTNFTMQPPSPVELLISVWNSFQDYLHFWLWANFQGWKCDNFRISSWHHLWTCRVLYSISVRHVGQSFANLKYIYISIM